MSTLATYALITVIVVIAAALIGFVWNVGKMAAIELYTWLRSRKSNTGDR